MQSWAEGDRVRVVAGSFQGFGGTIEQIDDVGANVVVNVFGRGTPVRLALGDLGLDDEPGGGGSSVREPREPRPPSDAESVRAELIDED